MSKTSKGAITREIKILIARMEEPRPSITLGRSDIAAILPILKKAIGE
jgi:hypothetical protein